MRTLIEVTDSTAIFKVIFYKKDEFTAPKALQDYTYQDNQYVRIFGQIRSFKEELSIVGHALQKIDDPNEVTNHFLKTFTADQFRKKGPLEPE